VWPAIERAIGRRRDEESLGASGLDGPGDDRVPGALGGDDFNGRWGAIESERDGDPAGRRCTRETHRGAGVLARSLGDKKTTCSSGDTLPAGQIEDTALDLTGRSLDAKVVSCRPGHHASGHAIDVITRGSRIHFGEWSSHLDTVGQRF
jgi:hypothetical protein